MPDSFVNASTCQYGLAGPDCTRTFASFAPREYHAVQIGYELVGVALLLVSSYKYRLARRHAGSKVQHRVFLMAMFCALTYVLRAVDPAGYDHILPPWVCNVLADSCTAMLYSAYILSCVFWISLIRQLKSMNDLPLWMRAIALVVNVVTWVFLLYDSFRFMKARDGYSRPKFQFKSWYLSIVLCLITAISLYYGFRIYKRLIALHEQMSTSGTHTMELSTTLPSPSSGYQGDLSLPDLEATKAKPTSQLLQLERTAKLASRMFRILVAMGLFSVVDVILQTYFGLTFNHRKDAQFRVHIDCSNGHGCEDLHIPQQWLCGMQAIGVVLIIWAYGKVRKPDEV